MEQEKNQKGNTVLLTVIAVATLLVAVIGATFAYFSATVVGNEDATEVIVKTATLGITYAQGNTIDVEDITPGWTDSLTFTVKNTSPAGSPNTQYNILMTDVTNTYYSDELRYSIACDVVDNQGDVVVGQNCGTGTSLGSVASPVGVPTTAGTLLNNISIGANVTHRYTVTFEFPNLDTNQNSNQGQTFAGKFQVEAVAMQ